MRRAALVAFGLLALFGCALRFWRLGEVGLWYDELWSVVGASGRPFLEVYREWMVGDPHPPGYFVFFFGWFKVFPNDEFWARVPSALAGVATVTYLLVGARRLFTLDERVMAATLAALSHTYVLYALTAKQYAAMLLFATVLTVSFLELLQARTVERGPALRFFGAAVVLAWLNYFATVYAALLGLGLAWTLRRELRKLVPYVAGAALLCVPLLWFQYLMLRYTPGDWQHDSFKQLVADFLPHLFFLDPAAPLFVGGLALAVVISLAAQPSARASLRTARNGHLLGATLAVFGFLLFAGLFKPVYFIRYFLIAFPALLLGLGVVLAAAFPFARAWLTLIPLVFFVRAAQAEFRHADALQRQHWDKSVDLVLAARQPGDEVCVLGAKQDKTMLGYLQAGDEWGVYYVRNPSFYRYYFGRRGAADVAARLVVVQPSRDAALQLVEQHRGSGRTVWILGGHHLKYGDDALEVLRGGARAFEPTQLFSTVVYKATF